MSTCLSQQEAWSGIPRCKETVLTISFDFSRERTLAENYVFASVLGIHPQT